MSLIYASTFTDALTKLTQAEAGAAIQTALRFAADRSGNGLQTHRIDNTDGFWSIRVSRDLRIILHKDGQRTLFAYVGHHEPAYRWAERKKLIVHERTGAMQFVEVPVLATSADMSASHRELRSRESDPASDAGKIRPSFGRPRPLRAERERPFKFLSDDQLLDVGVPRDWLQPVRETAEDELDQLFEKLPAEAAEALLDHATGGRLDDHVAVKAEAGSDPFIHPDAQRRFRSVEGLEELKAALEAPFEKWAVFLHPAQRNAVNRRWNGPARVSGSAGTGKTIVALHRAVRLAQDPDARVLLTTFSERLAENLAAKASLLTSGQPELTDRLQVRAIDRAADELYASKFGPPNLATPLQIREAIDAAVRAGAGGTHSAEFLLDEWEEVVDAWALHEPDAYATVPRIGRRVRLGATQRAAAWEVFAFVREWLAERGLLTRADLYGQLAKALAGGMTLPFTHFVVDEAQDLSVAQARFLAGPGAGRPDALFFAGDLGQRIFHLPFSWTRLGIDIRGRSQVLKVCYRTSHQIRSMADRLLAPEIADQDGFVETRRGTVSVFDGPQPNLRLFDRKDDEISAVGNWLHSCVASGIASAELAIIVRGEGQFDRARAAKALAEAEIPIITMHDAKGLEYRGCAVMAVDEDVLPDPERLEGVGDLADLEAMQDAERHLLYVACTRARDQLLVSGLVPGSEFLDDLQIR